MERNRETATAEMGASVKAKTFRGVSRHPFWMPMGGHTVAGWLHSPADGTARRTGVLICPPVGYEYAHTHRALRHLADALAERGYASIRLDYPGSGDSSGQETTPGLFDLWLMALDEAASRLAALTGGDVSLVGLRMGATLACQLATRREVRHLVAWSAVVKGSRYVRGAEALRRIAGEPPRDARGVLEAGGFGLSSETVDAMQRVDLRDLRYRVSGRALLVERDDEDSPERLAPTLMGQGISTTVITQSDYLDMVAEPQHALVPMDTIDAIGAWMDGSDPAERAPLDPAALESLCGLRAFSSDATSEENVWMRRGGSPELFGILTEPTTGRKPGSPIVLMPNAGSVHHVGPNRLYVELARALAASGVSSVRFDLRNLGDSAGGGPDDNHPYPATALADLGTAMEWLRVERGFDSFVVTGLCSGAYTAFHAGLELTGYPIPTVVSINPLTFYWSEGMSLDTPDTYRTIRDAKYYGRAIRDPRRWGRLVGGRSNVRYIARFLGNRVAQLTARAGHRAMMRLGLTPSTKLGRDLAKYRDQGRRIEFVFSSTDPGYEVLTSEAAGELRRLTKAGTIGVTMVPDADHTFTKKDWREAAISAVVRCVALSLGAVL